MLRTVRTHSKRHRTDSESIYLSVLYPILSFPGSDLAQIQCLSPSRRPAGTDPPPHSRDQLKRFKRFNRLERLNRLNQCNWLHQANQYNGLQCSKRCKWANWCNWLH